MSSSIFAVKKTFKPASFFENMLRSAALILSAGALVSCASSSPYNVIVANGAHQPEIEKKSLTVVWKSGNSNISVLKQQRGTGLQKPTITEDEKTDALGAGREVLFALSNNLAGNISRKLAGYVVLNGVPRKELVVEMAQNLVTTQGSEDVTVMAYLHPDSGGKVQWSRSIKISFTHGTPESAVVEKFSSAILAEMKGSGLVQ